MPNQATMTFSWQQEWWVVVLWFMWGGGGYTLQAKIIYKMYSDPNLNSLFKFADFRSSKSAKFCIGLVKRWTDRSYLTLI